MLMTGAPTGVETGGDGSFSASGGRPERHAAIFVLGFRPTHIAPMAGRLRIQDPQGEEAGSDSCRISNAPAARDAVESLSVGVSQRQHEGFTMASPSTTSASALTLSDLDTTADDDPRILDLRVAERLGFDRPRKIRDLIERNRAELETYGTLAPRRGAQRRANGATHEVTEYRLNEPQVLLVCMLSRTPAAAAVRQEVIEVFMAWRRDVLDPAKLALSLRDMDRARRLVSECRRVNGPRAAQVMWRDLGLPGAAPTPPALPAPAAHTVPEGTGLLRLGERWVTIDVRDTWVEGGERVLGIVPEKTGRTPRLEVFEAAPYADMERVHGDRTVMRAEPPHRIGAEAGLPRLRYSIVVGRVIDDSPLDLPDLTPTDAGGAP